MKFFCIIFLSFMAVTSPAQNIYISTEQDLRFGEFYITGTAGGTVEISDSGAWKSSGEIQLLNPSHQPAVFLLSTDSPTPIQVQVVTPASILTNSEGKRISLQLNSTGNSSHTLQEGLPKYISLGGILTLDPEKGTSSGDFSGSILITVIVLNE